MHNMISWGEIPSAHCIWWVCPTSWYQTYNSIVLHVHKPQQFIQLYSTVVRMCVCVYERATKKARAKKRWRECDRQTHLQDNNAQNSSRAYDMECALFVWLVLVWFSFFFFFNKESMMNSHVVKIGTTHYLVCTLGNKMDEISNIKVGDDDILLKIWMMCQTK